jgi:hypothetical protein
MTRHRRRLLAAVAGGLLVTAPTAAGAGEPPIVIAVESPQSGAQASNGRDQLRGVQLAVREVNARGACSDAASASTAPTTVAPPPWPSRWRGP